MKARTLLKKLTDYGLTVTQVDDKIRLYPRQLINAGVISFVRSNKEALLSALNEGHREKKEAIGYRLGTLQILLCRYLNHTQRHQASIGDQELEDFVDWVLKRHAYDVEDAIDTYHAITPEPVSHCKCGLKAPFCSCEGVQMVGVSQCVQCTYFKPDELGGGGIGACQVGIEATDEGGKMRPLYPHYWRHCHKFTSIIEKGKI